MSGTKTQIPDSPPPNAYGWNVATLAAAFPTLEAAPGVWPWDPEALDAWASGPVPGSGARYAAQFVLSVWNADADWRCGRFNAVRALGAWDRAHRDAFVAWARAPWTA